MWIPRLTRRSVFASLTLVAVGSLAGVVLWSSSSRSYETSVGAYMRAPIGDGDTVELNTSTQLNAKFRGGEYIVDFRTGEALFSLRGDRTQRYVVRAGQTVVRASRSSFTVRVHTADRVSVLVTQGAVTVEHHERAQSTLFSGFAAMPPQASRVIVAGEKLDDHKGSFVVTQFDPSNPPSNLAWRNRELRFDRQPLLTVVDEFNRYSTRKVLIADSSIERLTVSGRFPAADVDAFLARLMTVLTGGIVSWKVDEQGGAGMVMLYGPEHRQRVAAGESAGAH
jgi:transmembrane sensor